MPCNQHGTYVSQMSMWYRDGEKIQEKGLLVGYNHWVYLVIILQVAGGLVSNKDYIILQLGTNSDFPCSWWQWW